MNGEVSIDAACRQQTNLPWQVTGQPTRQFNLQDDLALEGIEC